MTSRSVQELGPRVWHHSAGSIVCVFFGGEGMLNYSVGECVGVMLIEADGVGFMAKRSWVGKNFSFF